MPQQTANSFISRFQPTLIRAAVGAAAVCVCPHGFAQGIATQLSTPGTSVLNRFDGVSGSQEDYIVGRSVKGPYNLAWKGIKSGTEVVTRDGVLLARGTDYIVDPITGAINFTSPLQPQQIVRVTYQCDTAVASPNAPSIAIPFKWSLYQSGKSGLTFSTLFRNDAATRESGATPLLSSLNFVGNTRLLTNSSLSSALFVDLRGGDWLDRSAISLADHSKFKLGEMSLSYSRAGKHMLAGSVAGLSAGKEISEFLTTLHPMSALSLKTTLRETTDLPDLIANPSAVATTTREGGLNLAVALKDSTRISGGRTVTSVASPGQTGVMTTSDGLKLERDLPGKTHIATSYDSLVTAATGPGSATPGSGSYSQKSALQVTTKAIDQILLSGSYKNELAPTGATDTGALSLEATPFHKDKKLAKLKIKAGLQGRIAPEGTTTGGSALIEIPALPLAQTTISGGFTYSSNPTRSQTVGLLDASSKPLKFFELSGGARLRDAYLADRTQDPSTVNTYSMKFSLGPSRLLKLTGNVAANPEASDGTVRKALAHNIGLESDFSLFKFTGQYGYEQQYTAAKLTNSMLLGFDLRLSKHDLLTTAWEGRSLLDTSLTETSIYRLGFTHKLGSAIDLSLSGSMTQQYINGVFTPNGQELKAEAKIGLHF